MSDKRETVTRTLLVAVVVSLVCSIVVSAAAVLLKPRQEINRERMIQQDILEVAGLLSPGVSVDEAFESVETRLLDLETGTYVDADPASFDPDEAAQDPATGQAIPPDQDIAQIGRRALWAKVYLVREDGRLSKIILPVRGYGLWSTMYGLVAITPDGSTVQALKFYEHAETPGLGDKIDRPEWRAKFVGKKIYGADGSVALEVAKGTVSPGAPLASYQVDGIAGATLTARGVSRTLRYWLGENAYGPFLARLALENGDSI